MRGTVLALGLALMTVPAAAQQVPPVCTDSTRACLLTVAKSYLHAIWSHDGSKTLLHPNVQRVEQGNIAEAGEAAIRKSLFMEPDMPGEHPTRYFVDEKQGTVIYFALLPTKGRNADPKREAYDMGGQDRTLHLAERIKVERGLITEIEAVFFPEMDTLAGKPAFPGADER